MTIWSSTIVGNHALLFCFFDKNGCEKEASYFVKGRVSASTKVLRAQKKCISNSSELNECSYMKVGHCDDKQHSTDDGSDGSFSGDFYCSGSKRNFSPDRCFKSSITKKLCINQDASKLISFLRTEKMIKEMKQNSSQAEIPALSFAKSISKRNPCFFKVLTKSSIRTKLVLVIPNDFVAAFKLFNPQIIILQNRSNKEWLVEYTHVDVRWVLLWRTFVKDNSFEVGDVCVFELTVTRPKMVMAVHIFSS